MSVKDKKRAAEYKRQHYLDNKDAYDERLRQYYEDNRSEIIDKVDRWKQDHPLEVMLFHIRNRAKDRGLDCNLEISDLVIPEYCPVFNIPLFKTGGKRTENTPSIDRIDNSKGYIKGNIWFISNRANALKSDATIEELEKLVSGVKPIIQQGGIWYSSTPRPSKKRGVRNPAASILANAKRNAKNKGIEFSIDYSDIVIPSKCPILGIPIFKAKERYADHSPSIDRIDPSKGYVKGNVWVISFRANRIKKDGSIIEFEKIIKAWHAKLEELGY